MGVTEVTGIRTEGKERAIKTSLDTGRSSTARPGKPTAGKGSLESTRKKVEEKRVFWSITSHRKNSWVAAGKKEALT